MAVYLSGGMISVFRFKVSTMDALAGVELLMTRVEDDYFPTSILSAQVPPTLRNINEVLMISYKITTSRNNDFYFHV